jgi:hypothetical protein
LARSVFSLAPAAVENILKDSINLKYFKQFCIREMSVENLLFYLEVEDYSKSEAPEYRKFCARKIYQKYIRPDAPMGVSVKDATRKKLKPSDGEDKQDPKRFDELLDEVKNSMKLDILPRFIESEEYHELLALKFEERKVADMSEFDLYRFLGAGGFGMVLLARKRENKKAPSSSENKDRFYAIKVIDKRILISQNQTHSIFREKEVRRGKGWHGVRRR